MSLGFQHNHGLYLGMMIGSSLIVTRFSYLFFGLLVRNLSFLYFRDMKLPKIDSHEEHVLISSSRGNRISYKSDEKLRFQVNVNRLLNVKSYLQGVMENEGQNEYFPRLYPKPKQSQTKHSNGLTSRQPFSLNNTTKLPPIHKPDHK